MIPFFTIISVLVSAGVAFWIARVFYKNVPQIPIKWLPYMPSWCIAMFIFAFAFMGTFFITVIAWWLWIFYGWF